MEMAGKELSVFLRDWIARYYLTIPEYCYLLCVPLNWQLKQQCILEREALAKQESK